MNPPVWLRPGLVGLLLLLSPVNLPLTDGDTAYYALIAQRMVESGDWFTLRYPGSDALVDKPPLTIWLIAASYLIFGVNELAIRLWHVLMSVGTVILLQATAVRFFAREAASLAGWVLLTSILFVYCAFVPQQDMPLTFFSTLAFYGLARFITDRRWRWTYLFWTSLALGLLARGPQAVLFPGLVAALTLFGVRWIALRNTGPGRPAVPTGTSPASVAGHLLLGGALFLAIGAPLFVHQYLTHGWAIIDLLLGRGQSRFLADLDTGGPTILHFWSYFPLLFVAVLPWSGWLVPSVLHGWRRLRRTGAGASVQYGGATEPGTGSSASLGLVLFGTWFLVAFLLPFLIQWRVIRYLLPALPPLAVLIADSAHSGGPRLTRTAAWMSMLIAAPVVVVVAVAYAGAFPEEQSVYVGFLTPFLAVVSIAVTGFAGLAVIGRRPRAALTTLVVGSLLAYAVLFQSLGNYREELLPEYAASRVLASRPEPAVIAGSPIGPSLAFYAQRAGAMRLSSPADARRFLESHGSLLILGPSAQTGLLVRELGTSGDLLWDGAGYAIVRAAKTAADEDKRPSP